MVTFSVVDVVDGVYVPSDPLVVLVYPAQFSRVAMETLHPAVLAVRRANNAILRNVFYGVDDQELVVCRWQERVSF